MARNQRKAEMSKEEEICESWETNALDWQKLILEAQIESRSITSEAIVRAIISRTPKQVLDAGCGEGWLVRKLSALGVRASGFDASSKLISMARENGPETYSVGTFDEVASGCMKIDAHYDGIVFNFSLLGQNTGPVLSAFANRLSSDGAIFIQTLHPLSCTTNDRYENGWRREDWKSFRSRLPAPMPWYFRTLSSWVQLLRESHIYIDDLIEPLNQDTGQPVSLLIVGKPRPKVRPRLA